MKTLKIPEAAIIRLSVYSLYLTQLDKKGIVTVSSGEIADGVAVSPAQVRKDLAYFGEFGTRGVGYNVKDLHRHIMKILGLNNQWSLVIVGAGNLGTALGMYRGFKERGFNVAGVFDADSRRVGQYINESLILSMDTLAETIKEHNVNIGIISVPAEFAQDVADKLIEAGVRGILNFAPTVVSVPLSVELRNVDLSVNLEVLTFNMALRKGK